MIGLAARSYTSFWFELISKTRSKLNLLVPLAEDQSYNPHKLFLFAYLAHSDSHSLLVRIEFSTALRPHFLFLAIHWSESANHNHVPSRLNCLRRSLAWLVWHSTHHWHCFHFLNHFHFIITSFSFLALGCPGTFWTGRFCKFDLASLLRLAF